MIDKNRVFKSSKTHNKYVDVAEKGPQRLAISLFVYSDMGTAIQVRMASRSTAEYTPFKNFEVRENGAPYKTLDGTKFEGQRLSKAKVRIADVSLHGRSRENFILENQIDAKLADWLAGLLGDEGYTVSEDLTEVVRLLLLDQLNAALATPTFDVKWDHEKSHFEKHSHQYAEYKDGDEPDLEGDEQED